MALLNNTLPNEFTTSLDNNDVRPYTVGMERHSETLATILLYTKDQENRADATSDTDNVTDYLNDLTTRITSLENSVPASLTTGQPQLPSGKIARLEKLDGVHDYYGVFNNFSLLNVQESHSQIVKIHQNFSAGWNVFFFGEKPRVYSFNGFFLDSVEYPYYQEFMVAYENYLAGRKLIEKKMQMKIIYDGRLVEGYIMDINTRHAAADQLTKQFQFTMLVTGSRWIRNNVIIRSKDVGGNERLARVRGFNYMSNIHRLKKQLLTGTIDPTDTPDTSGRVVSATNPVV